MPLPNPIPAVTGVPTGEPSAEEYATAVTFERAGAILGVSRSTVYKLVNDGQLGTVRIYGLRRIRLTELRRFLDHQEARVSLVPMRRNRAQ